MKDESSAWKWHNMCQDSHFNQRSCNFFKSIDERPGFQLIPAEKGNLSFYRAHKSKEDVDRIDSSEIIAVECVDCGKVSTKSPFKYENCNCKPN